MYFDAFEVHDNKTSNIYMLSQLWKFSYLGYESVCRLILKLKYRKSQLWKISHPGVIYVGIFTPEM